MTQQKFSLSVLPEFLAICHFERKSPVPEWADNAAFCSITRTRDELSIVCPQTIIPGGVLKEDNWRAFKLEGEISIDTVGVIASLSKPLADEGISVFNISTFQTNYILVEDKNLKKAIEVLGGFCEIK